MGIEKLLADIEKEHNAILAADTPENEQRVTALLRERGIALMRGRKKGPARYTIKMSNGSSMGPITLLDAERLLQKNNRKR